MEQLAQKLPLPAIPDIGTHSTDIGGGEDQKQAEMLRRLHILDNVLNGLWILEIALEGICAHEKMKAHKPRDGLGGALREPETRAEMKGDLGTDLAMVAASPFADIVQKRGNEKLGPKLDARHQTRGQRQLVADLAILDLMKDVDGPDGVLVHGEDMVEIVLHERYDPAEIRNEPADHARIIHPRERHRRVMARDQHLDELAVGVRILAHGRIDTLEILAHRGERIGMNVQLTRLGEVEQRENLRRLPLEEIGLGKRPPGRR